MYHAVRATHPGNKALLYDKVAYVPRTVRTPAEPDKVFTRHRIDQSVPYQKIAERRLDKRGERRRAIDVVLQGATLIVGCVDGKL